MPFWNEIITKKSFKVLQELNKNFSFVLIGGWAIWLYTHSLKSKDIDLICQYEELENFRKKYDLFKNERLKKYEIKIEEIEIDIYLPFYSQLGVPIKEIMDKAVKLEGFLVPRPEELLILKQFAFLERQGSLKGEKDKIDIFSLLNIPLNFDDYKKFLPEDKYLTFKNNLTELLKETKEIPDLDLNQYKISRLRKDILGQLK